MGDRLPLFSQVNAIQGILLSKDAFGKKIGDVEVTQLFAVVTFVMVECQSWNAEIADIVV